jgi:hypothetical protein
MSNMRVLVPLVVSLLIACGGKKEEGSAGGGGGGKVASCNMPSLSSCREYSGANLAIGTEPLAKLCSAGGSDAKFAEVACPTDKKVVGTCTMPTGKDFFYEGYPGDVANIAKTCASMGGK